MNDLFGYLFIGGFVLLAALNIIAKIYSWFDHSSYDKTKLRLDAKIINVKRRVVGGKKDKKIRTTVIFDDGFEFDSYKTGRDNSLFSYRIQVSQETKNQILEDAILAHQKACGKTANIHKENVVSFEREQKTIPQSVIDHCKRLANDPEHMKRYLEECVNQNILKPYHIQLLLNKFAVKQPPRKTAPSSPPRHTTAAGTRQQTVRQSTPASLEEEFLETYLQTRSKPLGNEEEAWNWAIRQILSFQKCGLGKNEILELECNVITNLPNCYEKHFCDFLALAGDMTPIVIACERLLANGNGPAAKAAADPYLKYLLAHPEKYSAGQLCLQGREEAALCLLEGRKLDAPKAEDNYTMFLVMYCRILDNILYKTEEELSDRNLEKERYLTIAAEMSPCNATVWEALAKVYTNSDEQKYHEYIQKALRYTFRSGEPYGLGAVYANLAMHYTKRDPQLAYALCELCRKYEGNPIAAEYVLSRTGASKPANPDVLLRNAGIQQGFSTFANTAIQLAQEQ